MDLDLPSRWADAAPNVLPVLRGPTSPANAWLAALDNADAVGVRRSLAPFLDVVAVLDLPELRVFVNHGHLAGWNVTAETVLAAALDNVQPSTGLQPWSQVDGVWQLAAGDGYDSSRLCLPGWLAAFADQVRGQPVAVVPDARTLLVCGSDAGMPLEAMLHAGFNGFHAAGTPVSPAPYSIDDHGRVVPWHPPRDHRLVHRVDACHRLHAGNEYRRQHEPLDEWLRHHDSALYVSTYTLLRHGSGRVVSLATWPDGPTLLPRTDLVLVGAPGPDALDRATAHTWDALVGAGLIGEPEPGLAPVRFRVGHHPAALPPAVNARTWEPTA